MLQTLTIETFTPHVGGTFRMQVAPAQVLELELLSVTPITAGQAEAQSRKPFSLLFRGPAHLVAPQQMYPIEHASLGTSELFVVPLGPGQGGILYEIIFS
jgi:hypothetical protein